MTKITIPKTKTVVKVVHTNWSSPMTEDVLQACYDNGGRLVSVNQTSNKWMYIFEHEVVVQ